MGVRFNRGALRDLEEIFQHIAADNPRAAASLVRGSTKLRNCFRVLCRLE
jgi:plasmid stabilization system protein ParE